MPRARKIALAVVAVVLMLVASMIALQRPTQHLRSRPTPRERPHVVASKGTIEEDARRAARARWQEQRARIHAAHERRARDDAPRSQAPPSRGCADGECSADAAEQVGDAAEQVGDAAEQVSDALFASYIDETMTLTQGCEHLIEGAPASVRITARLIGAPDVGTIVESVAASSAVEHLDALSECLTEGMYALELGEAETAFQRDAVLTLGLLDEVAGEGWLTPERVAEIRQQMIDGGLDPAKDPMVHVDADEAPSMP